MTNFTLSSGTCTITYSDATAPSLTIGSSVFTTEEETSGGTLTALAAQPSVTLTWSSSTAGSYSITVLANSAVCFSDICGGAGGGGAGNSGEGGTGGAGGGAGCVSGTIPAQSASYTLTVVVAGGGNKGTTSVGGTGGSGLESGGNGGTNGSNEANAGGGGGSSALEQGSTVIAIASGGGGGGGGTTVRAVLGAPEVPPAPVRATPVALVAVLLAAVALETEPLGPELPGPEPAARPQAAAVVRVRPQAVVAVTTPPVPTQVLEAVQAVTW